MAEPEPEQPIVTYMCFSGGGGGRGGKGEERGKRGRVKNVYQIFWVSWSLDLSFFAKLSHNLKFVVEIVKKTIACGESTIMIFFLSYGPLKNRDIKINKLV